MVVTDLSYVPEPRPRIDAHTRWLLDLEEPRDPRTVKIHWLFNHREFARIRQGFLPCVMEEKWFIYFRRCRLFLSRSWTAKTRYVLEFVPRSPRPGMVVASRLLVAQDPERWDPISDDQACEECAMVLEGYVLGRPLEWSGSSGMDPLRAWSLMGAVMTRPSPG